MPRRRGRRRPAARPRPAPARRRRRPHHRRGDDARRRGVARRARGQPAGHPGPRRRRGALGRGRGRLAAARRPRRVAADGGARRLPRAGDRPARRPRRPLRPHPRSVRGGGPRALARARPGRRRGRPAPARRHRPGRRGRPAPGSDRRRGGGTDFCDAGVLRTIRRRSLAALRAEVEPVTARDLARFLPAWQGVGGQLRGLEGLVRAVEQLGGAVLPASALETLVLPGRVAGYTPGMLDELMSSGDVLWRGHGSLPGDDGWVSLHVADLAPLTLPPPDESVELGDLPLAVLLDALASGGAYFFRSLSDVVGSTDDEALTQALWDLVWAGRLTNDTLAPLRALLGGGRTAHKKRATGPRRGRYTARPGALGMRSGLSRPSLPARTGPPAAAGRWSLLPGSVADPTRSPTPPPRSCSTGTASSPVAASWPRTSRRVRRRLPGARRRRGVRAGAARVLRRGPRRRAVRHHRRRRPPPRQSRPIEDDRAREDAPAVVLAACDPASPYGAALPWPDRTEHASDDPTTAAGDVAPGAAGSAGATAAGAGPAAGRKGPRGHQPAARRARSWSSSTATSSSTSSAAAAPAHLDRRPVVAAAGGRRPRARGPRGRAGAADGRAHRRRAGPRLGPPVADALARAGFHATPRGLRLRR